MGSTFNEQWQRIARKRGLMLKRARSSVMMTARELAAKANVCKDSNIYAIEAGRVLLSQEKADAFAKILGVDSEMLMAVESAIAQQPQKLTVSNNVLVKITISGIGLEAESVVPIHPPGDVQIILNGKEVFNLKLVALPSE